MKYLILALLILGLGCSAIPSHSHSAKMDLSSIALQYHQYFGQANLPPGDAESLLRFSDPHGNLPLNKSTSDGMKNALTSGDYVVYWGYDVAANSEINGSVVLAYHKDVPTQGGFVAFADGFVRSLSSKEFQDATKADSLVN